MSASATPKHHRLAPVDARGGTRRTLCQGTDTAECASGQDAVAHDQDLSFHPALGLRPASSHHVDCETGVIGDATASRCSGTPLPGRRDDVTSVFARS